MKKFWSWLYSSSKFADCRTLFYAPKQWKYQNIRCSHSPAKLIPEQNRAIIPGSHASLLSWLNYKYRHYNVMVNQLLYSDLICKFEWMVYTYMLILLDMKSKTCNSAMYRNSAILSLLIYKIKKSRLTHQRTEIWYFDYSFLFMTKDAPNPFLRWKDLKVWKFYTR